MNSEAASFPGATEAKIANLRAELERLILERYGPDAARRDSLRLHLNMHFELRGPDGALKEDRWEHNLICTAGKNTILAASERRSTLTSIRLLRYRHRGDRRGHRRYGAGDGNLQIVRDYPDQPLGQHPAVRRHLWPRRGHGGDH